jgi:WD40-like Beta Propeller Repeat
MNESATDALAQAGRAAASEPQEVWDGRTEFQQATAGIRSRGTLGARLAKVWFDMGTSLGIRPSAMRRALLMNLALLLSGISATAAAPSPFVTRAGGSVVYIGMDGSLDRLELGSGMVRQVVAGPGRMIHNPVWSPDGSRIAYLAAPDIQQPGRLDDIYIVSADGKNSRRVANIGSPLHDLTWLPDASGLLYGTGFNGGFQTHVLRLNDGSIADVPTSVDPLATYSDQLSPRVSPDGTAFTAIEDQTLVDGSSQQGIVISSIDGQTRWLAAIFGDTSHFLSDPSWTPGGSVIYGDGSAVRQVGLDGSPATTLFDLGSDVTGPFVYSPNGSRLAAHAARAYDRSSFASTPIWGLLLIDPDGANAQVIDVGAGRQLFPAGSIEWAGSGAVLFAAAGQNLASGSSLMAVQPDGTGLAVLVNLGEFSDFDWHQ